MEKESRSAEKVYSFCIFILLTSINPPISSAILHNYTFIRIFARVL